MRQGTAPDAAPSGPPDAPSATRLASAQMIGTTIEWYDFFIYGTASALVFNHVFFPELPTLVGTFLSLATFAAGFLARPLGAILFGYFGDRAGRKRTLVVTLLLMGGATVAVGLLPSYATVGAAAPILLLLLLLRIVQGMAVGGEWGGAALIGIEHAEPRRKTLFGAFAQLGSPLGLIPAASGG
ncbi:MFS transporter [Streptomyces rugosispiralis]|uniref:MFS transporter n=1 Tax=Streptomyces rugosispiralis TaxID=2967341 RepID=A0ABT1VAG3_9ACTN|nr:MFS transporter [Streptomyces rugosispiralis]MCQ8193755.1 MFS transporter [Streptomyces rugosispiralis]